MTIGLTALVERHLTERRTPGFQLRSSAYSLRSLVEYIRRTRHRGPLTLEDMTQWARLDTHASVDPRTLARRLKNLRSFARWIQQFEPATEVPDDTIFGRLPERQVTSGARAKLSPLATSQNTHGLRKASLTSQEKL